MPKKGYTNLTISEELNNSLKLCCEKFGYKTIPEFLRDIIRKCERKQVLEEVSPLR